MPDRRAPRTNAVPPVVPSSTGFAERELPRLCALLAERGIDSVELSGNIAPLADEILNETLAHWAGQIAFYVHNYFPPPAVPFVLNLAHPDTVARSVQHCRHAIDLCATFGVGVYSIHAGLSFNPHPRNLGRDQAHLEPLPMGDSRAVLMAACRDVAVYARDKGVRLLLENNVVAPYNAPEGRNIRYHMADPTEAASLLPLFEEGAVGWMLDTGHLKVSARTLGFDPADFLALFAPYIEAVQLSDNDGTTDQNHPVTKDSWFWPAIPWRQAAYVSLEVCGETPAAMTDQIALTRALVGNFIHADNRD